MSATCDMLDFAAAPHRLSVDVRQHAQRLLADTLAVGAAGAGTQSAQALQTALGMSSHRAPARTLGGYWVDAQQAAFVNGFAIHCLEWDAVHEGAVVHALSVVTAALLAGSDRMGGSAADELLCSLAVGVDIASGLGLSATGPMRFFRPATAGVIGAALALARLEGCSREQMADVLGLAYSFAGGTMQAHLEGSIALPLQIGRAAQAAVQVVDLVKAGMSGPHDVLEGPFGYAALIEPLDLQRYRPGQPWRIAEVSVKPYPCGRASHGALGALAALQREAVLSAEQIAAVDLYAPPLIHRLVGRTYRDAAPMSYNRLCLAFLVPLMLRDGHIDPRLVHSDAAQAAMVRVHVDSNADGNAMVPQRLHVTLRDGSSMERGISALPGSPDDPMEPAVAATKYALCRAMATIADQRLFDDPLLFATEPR